MLPGVFVGSQAITEGWLTKQQLRTRGYRRLVQGVYADPALPVDHRLRCRGVALLLPHGAAIGGHSAAAWYGAAFAGVHDPVTVVRPLGVEWKGPRGVRVHRSQIRFTVVQEAADDVPITSALRTAWDVAALEPLGTAVAALDAMVRADAVALSELTATAMSGTGQWGVTRFRRAVSLIDARAQSAPESKVRVALVLAGLTPVPQYEVCGGEHPIHADLAFPEARIAIEYEGAYHFDGDQIVRDDARYARMRDLGWTVIRLAAADLRDLDAVVARVRAALMAIGAF
jgi:hypothetical protein